MNRCAKLAVLMAIGLMAYATATPAWAQSPVSAQQFYNQTLQNSNLYPDPAIGHGEGWAWHAAFNLSHFMRGYQAWGDPAWLQYGTQYYDWIIDRMQTGPDGYKGWIGAHISNSNYWADTHVSDAMLLNGMLVFSEIVMNTPSLQPTWGQKAMDYVELAKVHVLEKWDARGTYMTNGPYGGYLYWDQFLEPGNLEGPWAPAPVQLVNTTQQFNKQNDMALTALRIYRITGEEEYRQRAVEIFRFLKSRMQLYDDHHVWNFREPFDQRGVNPQNNTAETWVAVHPSNGGYQASEVADIVEAFHSGIVFDEQDIQRIINTNLEVMWNGSFTSPSYKNSNAAILPGGLPDSNTVGRLWTALQDFDQTIRDLRRFGTDNRGRIDRAYFENVVLARAPGFERLLMGPGDELWLLDMPFAETRYLNMAFAGPAEIEPGESMVLAARSLVSGQIEVSLYSEDGSTLERVLFTGSIGANNFRIIEWLDTEGLEGSYRIRWTLVGDGYREFPILIGVGPVRWKVNDHGFWSDSNNWNAGIPNEAGKVVMFGPVITAARTVLVDQPVMVGALRFNNANRYTLSGSNIITIDGAPGQISVEAGSHTISAPVKLNVSTTVNVATAQSTLTLANLLEMNAELTKSGAGVLEVNRVRSNALNVEAGTVRLLQNAGFSRVGALSIAAGATLDLTDNELIVQNGNVNAIAALVASGRAGGSWTGTGITSSIAALEEDRAVGIGLDGADVRVKLTYAGDATLDDLVTIADLGILAANWQSTGAHWFEGDFNYDGEVTIADLGILAANWQKGVGTGSGSAGSGMMSFEEALILFDIFDSTAIPEPASAGLLGLVLLAMRRRTCRNLRSTAGRV